MPLRDCRPIKKPLLQHQHLQADKVDKKAFRRHVTMVTMTRCTEKHCTNSRMVRVASRWGAVERWNHGEDYLRVLQNDLSPIENMWTVLKGRVRKQKTHKFNWLCKDEWSNIQAELDQKLVWGYQKQLVKVKLVKGKFNQILDGLHVCFSSLYG